MSSLFLIFILPFAAGVLALAISHHGVRRALLLLTTASHLGVCIFLYRCPPVAKAGSWIMLDGLGLVFLFVISILFFLAAIYTVSYLRSEAGHPGDSVKRERVFITCLLMFLGTMSLVTVSHHLMMLWVTVETTTLFSAPLIYFHKSKTSLEATWKYLVICSVGIALGLLGTLFLATAGTKSDSSIGFTLTEMIRHAKELDPVWLDVAFILLLVGYGTKMGLAPMHTWLPDAHSEAPAPVSALFSGVLLNCAFLAILRTYQICVAAGRTAFALQLFIVFGLLSMLVSVVFLMQQPDYKRMLAYSSVEHMGILSLSIGLGAAGAFPAMLHLVNHSFTKALLFFTAGNILIAYHTKQVAEVKGCLHHLPVSGFLWLAGFLSITGTPPFAPFVSEFNILGAAIGQGKNLVAVLYLFFLATVFVGMARIVLPMAQGSFTAEERPHESLWRTLPPLLLFAALVVLGLYLPEWYQRIMQNAAALLQNPIQLLGGGR
jgi:hydrogenase-4 component F